MYVRGRRMMTGSEALMLQGWGLRAVQTRNVVTGVAWKDLPSGKHT